MDVQRLSPTLIQRRAYGCPVGDLFLRGQLQRGPRVAIVGPREASAEGRARARALARDLADDAIAIHVWSGLALGCDSAAHKGALDAGGHTVACLPSPLHQIYPAENKDLAARIVERGGALIALWDHYFMDFAQHAHARNRLLVASVDVVVAAEVQEKGGTLFTCKRALATGVPLYLPKSLMRTRMGHRLLTDGALVCAHADDIAVAAITRYSAHLNNGGTDHEITPTQDTPAGT